MPVKALYTLACTGCGNEFMRGKKPATAESPEAIKEAAELKGWIVNTGKDQEMDYCVSCLTAQAKQD